MKQIAIIAPTASGKTALSIKIAKLTNSVLLSLDSLSVYKEINIASAKPNKEEQDGVIHFGIDEVYVNEKFDVIEFISVYKRACAYAKENSKNLIIVGGTGFYLKILLDGISYIPNLSEENKLLLEEKLHTKTIQELHKYLNAIDPIYMKNIKINDKYRIQKALSIFIQTKEIPSEFFRKNQAVSIAQDIKLFEILWNPELLRHRIAKRTKNMIEQGLIEEVIFLEQKYRRNMPAMASIGIKETLEYLDSKITKLELQHRITIATAQLAKRQRTFNRGQFENLTSMNIKELEEEILQFFH